MGHISGSFLTLSILLYILNLEIWVALHLYLCFSQVFNVTTGDIGLKAGEKSSNLKIKIIQREDFTAIIHLKFLEDICNKNMFSGP